MQSEGEIDEVISLKNDWIVFTEYEDSFFCEMLWMRAITSLKSYQILDLRSGGR